MAICDVCKGITYRYLVVDGRNVCPACRRPKVHHKRVSTFPFTTTHMSPDGQPVTVNSMSQLRRLESKYGVHSHVYNSDNPERDYQPDRGELVGVPIRPRR